MESAGHPVADPETALPITPVDQALQDRLWNDAESLLAICRRHAALALASPADARASRLAACRVVWLNYATAFGATSSDKRRFADELLDVTRALMAGHAESNGAPPEAEAESSAAHAPQAPALITIEELRPLLQQIIRQ